MARKAKKRVTPRRKRAAKRTRPAKRKAAPKPKTAKPKRKPAAKRKSTPRRKAAPKRRPTAKPRPAAKRKRPARRTPPPPAFQQTAGASPKQQLIFQLLRARTAVKAAVAGLGAGSGDEPIAPGKWSARETLLHLVTRDQARLVEMEAALRGTPESWAGYQKPDWARVNAENMAPIHHLSWDDTVRLLDRTRERLLEALESVPDDQPELWTESHAFGQMFLRFPNHDRHHADILKRWRTTRGG